MTTRLLLALAAAATLGIASCADAPTAPGYSSLSAILIGNATAKDPLLRIVCHETCDHPHTIIIDGRTIGTYPHMDKDVDIYFRVQIGDHLLVVLGEQGRSDTTRFRQTNSGLGIAIACD